MSVEDRSRPSPAEALAGLVSRFGADTGTIHRLGADGLLHLVTATPGLPQTLLETIRTIPVGKGMAGLAVERAAPVSACNIQTDESGDVRPGARASGLTGAVVVPILDGERPVGALGIANRTERVFTEAEIENLLMAGRSLAPLMLDETI
jgi:signal transduction protein with GAF and PtsI domain